MESHSVVREDDPNDPVAAMLRVATVVEPDLHTVILFGKKAAVISKFALTEREIAENAIESLHQYIKQIDEGYEKL